MRAVGFGLVQCDVDYDTRPPEHAEGIAPLRLQDLANRRFACGVLLPQPVPSLQLLEDLKAEIAAIKANPDLNEEEKQEQAKNKMQALYAASGCAKVKGALDQVERALQEGDGPCLLSCPQVL